MQKLESRIQALEKAQPPHESLTIIRRFVSPGYLGQEIDHIEDKDGNSWTREPCESEADFCKRAERETKPNPHGIRLLLGKTLELSHATH